ncbi:MAG: hypothetical protein PHQ65_09215 [Bacteroidales bacterium]|nr:hypothetical protein [Bacteroidales bacterium]
MKTHLNGLRRTAVRLYGNNPSPPDHYPGRSFSPRLFSPRPFSPSPLAPRPSPLLPLAPRPSPLKSSNLQIFKSSYPHHSIHKKTRSGKLTGLYI